MQNESFAFYIAILRKYFVSYCAEKLSELGVTYSQLFVLIYISKKENCSSKEIAEYLKIDAGQLNRILTKLLEKNFIIQRKNEKDRRFNILSVTPDGSRIIEESRSLFYTWDALVLSDLDDDRREQLMDLMKHFIQKLNDTDGGTYNEQIGRLYEQIDRKI